MERSELKRLIEGDKGAALADYRSLVKRQAQWEADRSAPEPSLADIQETLEEADVPFYRFDRDVDAELERRRTDPRAREMALQREKAELTEKIPLLAADLSEQRRHAAAQQRAAKDHPENAEFAATVQRENDSAQSMARDLAQLRSRLQGIDEELNRLRQNGG